MSRPNPFSKRSPNTSTSTANVFLQHRKNASSSNAAVSSSPFLSLTTSPNSSTTATATATADLTTHLKNATATIQTLSQEASTLRTANKRLANTNLGLQDQLNGLNYQLDCEEDEKEQLTKQIEALKEEVADVKEEGDHLALRIEILEGEVKAKDMKLKWVREQYKMMYEHLLTEDE